MCINSRPPNMTAKRYVRALAQARGFAKTHRPALTPEEREQLAHVWAGKYLDELALSRSWITHDSPIDPMRIRMTDLAKTLAKLRKSAEARGTSKKELQELGHAQTLLHRMRRDYEGILHDALAAAHADAFERCC